MVQMNRTLFKTLTAYSVTVLSMYLAVFKLGNISPAAFERNFYQIKRAV